MDVREIDCVRQRRTADDHEPLAKTRVCGRKHVDAAFVDCREIGKVEEDRRGGVWTKALALPPELASGDAIEVSGNDEVETGLVASALD